MRYVSVFLVLCVACANALVFTTALIAATATHVVISEVAVNVGGAANEFVELYNPTASAIDLQTLGLKLHVVNSAGTTDTSKTLTWVNTTIPAYGFFLIASTGYVTATSVAADATYSASSNGLVADGAVYISTSATAGANVIDALDYGTDTADVSEGALAADIPNNQSLERKASVTSTSETLASSGGEVTAGNGEDSDDNAADFVARATPEPQTSVVMEVGDGGGPPADTTAPTTTASPAGGIFHSAQTVTLTADEATTIYYTLDGSEPTVSSNVYATSLVLDGTTTVRLFAVDTAGNSETPKTETYTLAASTAVTGAVILSEIAWAGSGVSISDEWVELFNSTSDTTYDLTNWVLAGAATGGGDLTIPSGLLPPGGFFLVANNAADHAFSGGESVLAIAPDFFDTSLALSNSALQIILKDSVGTTLDTAGDGATPLAGNSSTPATMVRKPLNSSDGTLSASWVISARATNLDAGRPDRGTPRAANFLTHDIGIFTLTSSTATPLPSESATLTATVSNATATDADGVILEFFDGDPLAGGVSISYQTISIPAFSDLTATATFTPTAGAHVVYARVTLVGDEDSANDSATTNVTSTNHVVISEFIPDPTGSDETSEWVEFFNPTDVTVDLTGFTFASGSLSATLTGSLAAGGYAYAFANDPTAVIQNTLAWSGNWPTLANSTGTLTLKNSFDTVVDAHTYTDATESVSFGRLDSDVLTWTTFHHPTRGAANLEANQTPLAAITVQSASSCSLSVNLDGSSSSDADGDALTFAWDFGDGTNSIAENPGYHTYATAGTYVVRLTVTDVLSATNSASQSFTVATCGGGGSARATTITTTESEIVSILAVRVRLLISEVGFHSKPDFIEVFVADDGANGAGVDLGGFYLDDGKRIKTIPHGLIARSGEYVVLTFDSKSADDFANRRLFSTRDGLVKTDVALSLRDSSGSIADAVVWANRDGAWSRGKADDVADVISRGGWNSTGESAAVDSRAADTAGVVIARNVVNVLNVRDVETVQGRQLERLKRVQRSNDLSVYVDTNSAADWFTTPFATPGAVNGVPPTRAADVRLLVTSVAFRNRDGDTIELTCAECGADGRNLSGFFVKLADAEIWHAPDGFVMRSEEVVRLVFKNVRNVEDVQTVQNERLERSAAGGDRTSSAIERLERTFTIERTGLRATDGLISVKDFADTTVDFVCYSDRAGAAERKYDLTVSEAAQLEEHVREGEWSEATATSCLDSRAVGIGGVLKRKTKYAEAVQDVGDVLSVQVVENERLERLERALRPGFPLRSATEDTAGQAPRSNNSNTTYFDTNSAADWEIVAGAEALKITPQTSRDIFISEILSVPLGGNAKNDEWVELVNRGSVPVELFGWRISTGRFGYTFEDSFVLAPGEFRAIADELLLRNDGGNVTLFDFQNVQMDDVAFPKMAAGESYIKMQNAKLKIKNISINSLSNSTRDRGEESSSRLDEEWVITDAPTRDAPNYVFILPNFSNDSDGDGVADVDEKKLALDPQKFDTDGDQLPDGFELTRGLDPKKFNILTPELAALRTRELTTLLTARLAAAADEKSGFTVSGVGIPGGVVHLTIHSEPRFVDVPVGVDGRWEYVLDIGLLAGGHEVFTALADPTGLVSELRKVLSFSLLHDFTPPTFACDVRLSEIFVHPLVDQKTGEWVEFENTGDSTADVSNWILRIGTREIVLPANTMIAPHGFFVFHDSRLRLSDSGGRMELAWPNRKVVDVVVWSKIKSGVSYARVKNVALREPSSSAALRETRQGDIFLDWKLTAQPTPNAANRFVAVVFRGGKRVTTYADGDASDDVVISELIANPVGHDTAAREWIELFNAGTSRIRLGNYRLAVGEKEFVFSNATTIQPGEYRAFRRSETRLALKNSGDVHVALTDFNGRNISDVTYADAAEGVAFARDVDGSFRPTTLPTLAAANRFDTQKIEGIVRYVGEDGVVINVKFKTNNVERNEEVWIKFDDRGASLVARAVFVVGSRVTVFARSINGELFLTNFTNVESPVRFTPSLTAATALPLAITFVSLAVSTFIAYTRRRKLAGVILDVWNSR